METQSDKSEMTLHALDIYSLFNILKFLDINSQLHFALTCNKFRHVFVKFAKLAHRNISDKIINLRPPSNIKTFLNLIGENVLTWKGIYATHLLPLICMYCKNLQEISLDYANNWPDEYFEHVAGMKALQSLQLYASNRSGRTIKCLIQILHKLPNLQRLSVNTLDYDGSHLDELLHLRTLVITNYGRLNSDLFLDFCRSLTHLRCLKLQRNAEHMTTHTFSEMQKFCLSLEEFTFHTCKAKYELVADLPSLKYLHIYGIKVRNELFEALAAKKSQDLISLNVSMHTLRAQDLFYVTQLQGMRELQCWTYPAHVVAGAFAKLSQLKQLEILTLRHTAISNADLMQLVRTCKKLRFIDVYNCRQLNSFVVEELIAWCNQNRFTASPALRLCVKSTKIETSIVDLPAYQDVCPRLKLHFDRVNDYTLMERF